MSSRLIASTSSRISRFSSAKRHAIIPRFSRNVHARRALAYPVEEGLGDFLPPPALKSLAVDYQDGLLQRLTDEVRGTAEEHQSVAQTVINTAPDRSKSLAFNYASEALNNSFFLDFLKPPPPPPAANHEDEISPYLGTAIRHYEGSIEQLKMRVAATAMGMTSSGYVWFVTDQSGLTAVMPTYGSGTLLVRSRRQETPAGGLVLGEGIKSRKANEQGTVTPGPDASAASTSGTSATSPTSGLSHGASPLNPSNQSRGLHTTRSVLADSTFYGSQASLYSNSPLNSNPYGKSSRFDLSTLGETLYPLFCVSVHERAWMGAGYGVWGKEEWLKQFWTVLDWEKVSQAYLKFIPDSSMKL